MKLGEDRQLIVSAKQLRGVSVPHRVELAVMMMFWVDSGLVIFAVCSEKSVASFFVREVYQLDLE